MDTTTAVPTRVQPGAAPADPPEAAPFPPASRLRLPNGMTVVPQSRVEAEHFYEDLFEKRIYLRHGVGLAPGDCVFDVGGNIGMFSLFAHWHAPGARIYTFEPAPPLYQRLRANLALNGAAARAFNFGIAHAELTARFTFYPHSSGMSSFHADAAEERDVLRVMMDRQRQAGMEGMDALREFEDELLEERFKAVEMECALRPLSAVIREEGVERIDLLKIDVQKAELDVLRGIDDEHWPRIRQVVMEVHDLDGRLDTVTRLLRARGFDVAVEQDEAVEGSILYNLFAVRRTDAPRESAPAAPADEAPRPWHLLLLSAPSAQALDAEANGLARHLAAHPGLPAADVAFTLRQRPALSHRRAVVVREDDDVPARLRSRDAALTAEGVAEGEAPPVAFLFAGVGEQYPGMGRGLYHAHPVFRDEVDRCAALLQTHLGFDLREALFAEGRETSPAAAPGAVDLRRMLGRAPASAAAEQLRRTEVTQPAAFVTGYALARLWESWGVRPGAVMGHSLGEYTAACVAGVFRLEDALELVALRARAIQALPGGAMLAVSAAPEALAPFLDDGVALAAVNAPELCVLSGTDPAVARVERALAAAGHAARRLAATHAFHSPLMQPVAERVAELAARMRLDAPAIPLLSNVTGTWLTADQARDPGYWARHLVSTVQFARGAAGLLDDARRVLVEMGPGSSLCTFVRQQAAASGAPVPPGVASLPHDADDTPDAAFILGAVGALWVRGVGTGRAVPPGERPRIIPLPAEPGEPAAAPADDQARPASGAGPADGDGTAGGTLQVLAEMWRELLKVPAVDPDDDFFQLGGHSLVAVKLIAGVREVFGAEMRLRTIFQTRTVARMAAWIDEARAAGRPRG